MREHRFSWLDLVLPTRCHGCDQPTSPRDDSSICASCRLRLRRAAAPRCARCDHPARFSLAGCPGCEALDAVVGRVRSAVLHRAPADRIVRAFKYDGWRDLADFMALRMAPLLLELEPRRHATLVPVPSTPRRVRSRGFNPAAELATALSRTVSGRCETSVRELLHRPRESPRQVGLSPEQRRANVRNVFVPGADFSGVRGDLVLIDDVFTTGATAVAAAEVLARESGARVHVLTFARAVPELPDGADPS